MILSINICNRLLARIYRLLPLVENDRVDRALGVILASTLVQYPD